MGGQIYAGGGEDTIVRNYVKAVQPNSPGQLAQQGRIRDGSQGWGSLTDAERASWAEGVRAFGIKAKGVRRQKPVAMRPENYYTSLTAKFKACSPTLAAPKIAPTTRFNGDGLVYTLSKSAGHIEIVANVANKAGVKTEISVQRLAAAYRKPTPNGYRVKQFMAFTSEKLSASVLVSPGAYSVAIQYIETSSGQTSGFRVLGTVTVALTLEQGGRSDEGFEEGLAEAA